MHWVSSVQHQFPGQVFQDLEKYTLLGHLSGSPKRVHILGRPGFDFCSGHMLNVILLSLSKNLHYYHGQECKQTHLDHGRTSKEGGVTLRNT